MTVIVSTLLPLSADQVSALHDELLFQARRGSCSFTWSPDELCQKLQLPLAGDDQRWGQVGWYGPLESHLRARAITDIFWNHPTAPIMLVQDGRHMAAGGESPHPDWLPWLQRQLVWRSRSPNIPVTLSATGTADDRLRFALTGAALTPAGPSIAIRVLPTIWPSLDDLVRQQVCPPQIAAMLTQAVNGGATVLVSGMAGSGKTTLVAALLQTVAERQRVVTIEHDRELPTLPDHVAHELRDNADFTASVQLALRQKPQRIVLGEIRGAEALAMLWAAASGHPGMTTLHAPDPLSAVSTLELLAARGDTPLPVIRRLISSPSVQLLLVQIGWHRGTRQIMQIVELAPTSGMDGYPINPLYVIDEATGQRNTYPVQYGRWAGGHY